MKRLIIFSMLLLWCGFCANAQSAKFSANQTVGCVPMIVDFTDQSTGGPVAWSWDFGDGSTPSTVQQPTKTYYSAGTYSVKLTVYYGDGTSKDTTYTNYIKVSAGPQISFTAAPDSVCPGELVNFTESIADPSIVKSILWDFKDGGMSTNSKPSHAYANSGTYRPVLRVTDTLGCTSTDSVSKTIFVKPKPKANFTSNDSIFCVKASGDKKMVNFVSTSSSDVVSYEWSFDNGNTSTSKNPSETFSWGDYDVTLIVKSSNGCTDTLTKPGYVSVNLFGAQFNVTDTVVCSVPGKTTFTGSGGSRYDWKTFDENGGVVAESIGGSFSPEYKNTGRYSVQLIATSQLGCTDTVYIKDYIWVFDEIKPDIVIKDTHHCNPNATIYFLDKTNYDSGNDLGYGGTIWNFGDGSANQSGDSVTHVFGSFGIFKVTAYVTTPYGCRLKNYEQKVSIYPISTVGEMLDPAPPMPPGGCVPHEITVGSIDDSLITSSPITNYTWLWGDGDTTDTKMVNNGTHEYTDTGNFLVYLQITNEQGCVFNVFIQVIPVGKPPLNVWSFIDPGTKCINDFNITVSARDSMCLDSIFRSGRFVGFDTIPCAGVYANSWSWLDPMGNPIGSGKQSSLSGKSFGSVGPVAWSLSPSHNQCSGSGPDTSNIGYICPPAAKIQYPMPNPMTQQDPIYCDYPTIACADGSKNPCGWLWHFGNDSTDKNTGVWWEGDTSLQQSPTYKYKPGQYVYDKNGAITIRLWTFNNDTDSTSANFNPCKYCEDSATQMIYISHADMRPVATSLDSTPLTTLCQQDAILIWDSTNCSTALATWGIHIVDSLRNTDVPLQGKCPPFGVKLNQQTHQYEMTRSPYKHRFDEYGVYHIILVDTCAYGCGRGDVYVGLADTDWPTGTQLEGRIDTIRLVVNPRSIPNVIVPQTGCAGDSIQFLDASSTDEPFENYKITNYLWNSASKTDTAQNPYFVYTTGGVFDVSLKVTNEMGCDSTAIFKRKISIYSVNASWVLATGKYEACNKIPITFLSKVSTYPQSSTLQYEWEFNKGKKLWNSSKKVTTKNAVCSFNVDSTMYVTVTLTVTDTVSGCRSSYTDSILIRKPMSEFYSDDHISACPELQAPFIDQSYVSSSYGNTSIKKWEWFFEDKKDTAYSTIQNPTHIYTYAGIYDVSLVVTDDYGCTDTNYKKDYVQIQGPYGEYTMDTLSGCSPFTVQFSFKVQDADTLKLVTGDGNTRVITNKASMQMPLRYTYSSAGRYIPVIQLIKWVTDQNGTRICCNRTFVPEDTIWVIDLNPWFEIKDLYCKGVPITFNNLTDTIHNNLNPSDLAEVDSIYWSFGNNTFDSINFHGSTQYDSAGTYDVRLWAKAKTCNKATTRQIKVMEFPDIEFTHSDTSNCISLNVEFEAGNLNGEEKQFDWAFEDGVTGSGNPIKRDFNISGTYPYAVMITFSPDNCVHTYLDTVMINAWIPPVADFEIKDDDGNVLTDAATGIAARADAHFNDLTQPGDGQLSKWQWNWGDDDSTVITSSPGSTKHSYTTTSGYVDVYLIVEDEYGCTDTAVHQILIMESLKFPNVFSPNGDGINDVFAPTEDGGYFLFLEMIIYNKWGERVWRRSCEDVQGGNKECPNYDDPDFWWNGKNHGGADIAEGVYYWVLKARPLSESGDIIMNGSVTLVR